MMRWLSQLWVSAAADRGRPPSALWRWTFGRSGSHRKFAARMRELDGQLSRQAASQQRVIAQQPQPVGRYQPRSRGSSVARPWWSGLLRPAMTVGACAILAALVWTLWPNIPRHDPEDLTKAFVDSFERLREPLAEQAQLAGQSLREQTDLVRRLPQKLPPIDRVVNDLGLAIQTPIREEVRRFTHDLTEPWVYLAGQLPLPVDKEQDTATGPGA